MKRLGMIGTGAISQWHLERWQKLPVEIQLIAHRLYDRI